MRDFTYPPIIRTALTLFKVLDLKLDVSGQENIPASGGAIIASNHVGYVDFVFAGVPAWYARKRLVRFMAKKEVFDHRIAGPIMRSLHHIPVDRAHGEASFKEAVEFARAGELVGVFPEATISRAMEPKAFKTGAVRMAAEAGVPLIPMVVWGTQRLMTKDHPKDLRTRHRPISIIVGEPFEVTGDDPVAETERLREETQRLLDKAITSHPASPVGQWWAPARYGGLAPTLEEAARLDDEEKAARAAKRAAREQG